MVETASSEWAAWGQDRGAWDEDRGSRFIMEQRGRATEAARILRSSEWTGDRSDRGWDLRDKDFLGTPGIGAAGAWAVAGSVKLSRGTRRVSE